MNFKDSQEDARDLSNAEQRAILKRLLVGCQGFLAGCSGFSVEFQGFSRGCSRSFPCRAEGAIVKRPQEGCQGFLPGCSGFSIAFAKILEKDCSGARRNVSKENDAEHPRDSFFLGGGGCSESSVDTPRGFPVRCRRMLDCVPSRRSSFVLFLSVFFPQFAFVAWSINSRQPSEDEPKRVKKNEQMTNDRFRVEWKTMATSMQFNRNRRLVTKSLRWAD